MNSLAISDELLDIVFSYYQQTYIYTYQYIYIYLYIYAYNLSEIVTACINTERVNSLKYLGITLNDTSN